MLSTLQYFHHTTPTNLVKSSVNSSGTDNGHLVFTYATTILLQMFKTETAEVFK